MTRPRPALLALLCLIALGCETPPAAGQDDASRPRRLADISPTTYASFAAAVSLHEESDQFLDEAEETRVPEVRAVFLDRADERWREAVRFYRAAAFRDPRSAIIQRRMGEGYLRHGDVAQGQKHLEAAVRIDPGDFPTLFRLASIYERGKDRARLIDVFAKCSDARRDDLKTLRLPRILLNLAGLYEEEEENAKAVETYERFLKLDEVPEEFASVDPAMSDLMKSPVAVHLKLGRLYRALGKCGQSADAYLVALKLKPTILQALYEAAVSCRDGEDYARALSLCEQYVEKLPMQPNGHELLIDIYDCMGEPGRAVDAAKKILADHPAMFGLRLQLGRLYEKRGRIADAVAEYEQIVRAAPRFAEAYVRLAEIEGKRREYGRALAWLWQGMSAGVDEPTFYAEVDRRIEESTQMKGAVDGFEKAVPVDKRDYSFYYMLGQIQQRAKRFEESAEAYGKAVELGPDRPYAAIRLGALYAQMDRFEDAANVLAEGTKRFPDSLMMWRLLADVRGAADDVDGAIDAMKHALDIDPTNLRNGMLLGALMHRADRDGQFVDYVEGRLKARPEHAPDWTKLLASFHLDIGRDYNRAVDVLKEAAGAWPDDGQFEMTLGIAYARAGRLDEAVTTLTAALERDPGNPRTIAALVAALERAGRLDDAEKQLRAWVSGDPEEAEPKIELGLFLVRHRRGADEGLKAVREIADAAPENIERNMALVSAYRELHRHKDAAGVLTKLLKAHPENDALRYSLALTYDDLKDYGKAEKILRELLEKDPKDGRAANALGYQYAVRGIRLDEAERLVAVALEDDPDSGAYLDSMGWVYYRKGDLNKALDYLKRAAEAEPDDPVIVEHLGDVYAKLGQAKLALESWETAVRRDPDNAEVPEKIRRLREGKDPFK